MQKHTGKADIRLSGRIHSRITTKLPQHALPDKSYLFVANYRL